MSIRVSEKHGVNPSLMQCYFCGEDYGVALLGRLKGDKQAPQQGVYEKNPCPKCKKWMEQGILFISVRDNESGSDPYRTGKLCVIKEEAVKGLIKSPEMLADVLEKRVCFIEDAVWKKLGLPAQEQERR